MGLWVSPPSMKPRDVGPRLRVAGNALIAKSDGTRAITIDAPPELIWLWIVQMGYRRAGFYTYALEHGPVRPVEGGRR